MNDYKTLILDHKGTKIFKNKKNFFFLGGFCLPRELPPSFLNNNNFVPSHWKGKKRIIKKYNYLKKINIKIFNLLYKKLNKLHNKKEKSFYWKIIIYPWVCYFVAILYDRWETISQFKKYNKNKFKTYEYVEKNKFLEIQDTEDFVQKNQSEIFNNYIFLKILKFRKINNVFIKKKFLVRKKNIVRNKGLNKKNFFWKFFQYLLDKIGLYVNWIYFDKFLIQSSIFLKLCFRIMQIPSKNYTTFSNIFSNTKYDLKKRLSLKEEKIKKNSFENFLIQEIPNFLPIAFFENYNLFKKKFKRFFTKKIILGMHSANLSDYFKIFLAESKLKGSNFIYFFHGAGIHIQDKYEPLYNYHNDISDKIIVASKKLQDNKKKLFIGYNIFKKMNYSINNKKKLLINYHELLRYSLRPPVTTLPFSEEIKNFENNLKSFKYFNNSILNNLKFRPKKNTGIGLESEIWFSKFFGKKSIEDSKDLSYFDSIKESKLILCFIPQTSFIEPIFNNIPTILIGKNYGFFNSKSRQRLLKKMKKNNLFFDDAFTAVKFINKNWKYIDTWWNKVKTQRVKKEILDTYYSPDQQFDMQLQKFITNQKKELNI